MSRDGRYILSYEYQSYTSPTPMDKDKATVLSQEPNVRFVELDNGFTIYFEMPKYTLLRSTVDKLRADKVFEACDGDPYGEVSHGTTN